MSGRVVVRPRARLDLDEAAAYIQERSSPERAIRFLREASSTFALLATMPGAGTRFAPHSPLYEGLRYLPISRHRNHVVFYRPLEDGVEIVRVLHGARDVADALADELADEEDEEKAGDSKS